MQYPQNHIEADNRLAWFLGRLDKAYGDDAMYVHLRRKAEDTARSFVWRRSYGIIKAYRRDILRANDNDDPFSIAVDYCDTINSNIELFLKDKSRKLEFALEEAKRDFATFWDMIGAEGNFESAASEFEIKYNRSIASQPMGTGHRIARKIFRIVEKMPAFVKDA